jgi:hypothetical protein
MAEMVWARFQARRPDLIGTLMKRCRDQVPRLNGAASPESNPDVTAFDFIVRRIFDLAPRMGTWSAKDLATVRELSEHWARRGVPAADALAAMQTAIWSLHTDLWQHCGPGDHAAMWRLHEWTARRMPVLLTAVTDAYHAKMGGGRLSSRKRLAQSLINGGPSEMIAATEGLRLADGYLLMAVTLSGIDKRDEQFSRLKESVKAELSRNLELLSHQEDDVFLLLQPIDAVPAPANSFLASLADALRKQSEDDGLVCSAAGPVRLSRLPAAAIEVSMVARLASAAKLAKTLVRRDDVLPEILLAKETAVSARLAAVIERLDNNPELLHTLEVFFVRDLDRTATASALNIHRRTLTYRLSRITDLTGLSPTSFRGIQFLAMALAAYRLRDHRLPWLPDIAETAPRQHQDMASP